MGGGEEAGGGDAAEEGGAGVVGADEDAEFFVSGEPLTDAGIGPEPGDGGRVGHDGEVKGAGIAAEMEGAVLNDGGELDEVQVAWEDAPGFVGEQREEVIEFLQFARRGGAGEGEFFAGELFAKAGNQFGELGGGQFLGVGGGEGTEMKIGVGG